MLKELYKHIIFYLNELKFNFIKIFKFEFYIIVGYKNNQLNSIKSRLYTNYDKMKKDVEYYNNNTKGETFKGFLLFII